MEKDIRERIKNDSDNSDNIERLRIQEIEIMEKAHKTMQENLDRFIKALDDGGGYEGNEKEDKTEK